MSIFILYPQAYSYNYKLCVLCPTLKSVHKNILRREMMKYPDYFPSNCPPVEACAKEVPAYRMCNLKRNGRTI